MLVVTCCRAVEPTWCSFCARRLIPRLANRFDKISDVQIKLLCFFKIWEPFRIFIYLGTYICSNMLCKNQVWFGCAFFRPI